LERIKELEKQLRKQNKEEMLVKEEIVIEEPIFKKHKKNKSKKIIEEKIYTDDDLEDIFQALRK
jgi:hypothetical protein